MNPIPGPVILLALPVLAAGVSYVVRRLTLVVALVSTLTAAGLALLCAILPLGQSAFVLGQEVAFGRPIVVVGQTLVLDPAGKMWLAFAYALASILYLFAWRMSQGRSFFSFSLVMLALYSLMVMLPDFGLATLTFAFSATVAVFAIQAGQLTSVRGAQRYLVVILLAVPFLLGAAWLLEQAALDAAGLQALVPGLAPESLDNLEQSLTRWALLPAALGFGLLLAAFPFGTWMPALAADAPPLVSAFLFSIGQAMTLFLALIFLQDHPLIASLPATFDAIQLTGLVMAAAGGLMAAVQRDCGPLVWLCGPGRPGGAPPGPGRGGQPEPDAGPVAPGRPQPGDHAGGGGPFDPAPPGGDRSVRRPGGRCTTTAAHHLWFDAGRPGAGRLPVHRRISHPLGCLSRRGRRRLALAR